MTKKIKAICMGCGKIVWRDYQVNSTSRCCDARLKIVLPQYQMKQMELAQRELKLCH